MLDNSPLAAEVAVLEVRPALAPYEVGFFTLEVKVNFPNSRRFSPRARVSVAIMAAAVVK